ncbi:MAG TPA: 3'(2'),5'-bisphosphate nucleotidase CysQ [Aestuariivirgaceae bacterium]|nr:3'(2'),5'-bisphosphate nucleotidase CysQ [Aestuariivirgaceae bacterium]
MPAPDARLLDRAARCLGLALAEAGALALSRFRRSPRRWRKSDGTPVSEADIAVDGLLKSRLAGAFPDFGWISEESVDVPPGGRSPTWIVDPIDGTRSYLDGDDGWCVAVALVSEGRPVVAGIVRPTASETFEAVAGGGARLNGIAIAASRRRELEGAELMVKPNVLARADWPQTWPPVRTGSTGSLALRLCHVATGSFDAALAIGDKADWDLAAGDLIVHEAGGKVSDLEGAKLGYGPGRPARGGFLAAGANLHDEMLRHTAGRRTVTGRTMSGGIHG